MSKVRTCLSLCRLERVRFLTRYIEDEEGEEEEAEEKEKSANAKAKEKQVARKAAPVQRRKGQQLPGQVLPSPCPRRSKG